MEKVDKCPVSTAKDVEAMKLIQAYADFLKRSGKVELPKLHDIMRTKVFSEYSPYQEDWYFIRCGNYSSVLLTRSRYRPSSLHETWCWCELSQRRFRFQAPQRCPPCLPRSCTHFHAISRSFNGNRPTVTSFVTASTTLKRWVSSKNLSTGICVFNVMILVVASSPRLVKRNLISLPRSFKHL